MMVGLLPLVAPQRVLIDRRDRNQHRNLVLPGVDHLGHGIGQADIGDDNDAGAAGGARITVGHGDHGAFLNAFDQVDLRHVDQRIEDRMIAGRGIEEDVLDAGGLELLDKQPATVALDFADRGGNRLGRRRRALGGRGKILRHRFGRHGAHAERAQSGDKLPAR